MCVCVCVHVCMRACVHACTSVCVSSVLFSIPTGCFPKVALPSILLSVSVHVGLMSSLGLNNLNLPMIWGFLWLLFLIDNFVVVDPCARIKTTDGLKY